MSKKAVFKKIDSELMKEITGFIIEKLREEESAAAKARYNRRRSNTKLLLRNYRPLAEHCEGAVYDADTLEEDGGYTLADILEFVCDNFNGSLQIESIRQSAVRTRIILDHIDVMLGLYKTFCDTSPCKEDARRYRVIYYLYFADDTKTIAELAEEEYTDKRTIYRDINSATERLTALIFGIDGLYLR